MKNSLVLMIQGILTIFISIGVTAYTARSLGKADYGVFSFSIAFVLLFDILTNMGLRPLAIRELAKQINNSTFYIDRILFIRLILSLGTVIIIVISVNILNYPQKSTFIVYIVVIGFFFRAIYSVINDIFQGFEKMEFVAITEFIMRILIAILSVFFLYMGYGLITIAIIYSVGQFVGFLVAILFLNRYFMIPKPELDLRFSLKQIKHGLPFALSGLLITLYLKIDISMLSKMAGNSAVGLYSAAVNLTRNLGIMSGPIASAAYPAFAKSYIIDQVETNNIFRKYFVYLLMISLPMAIGINLIAKRIILFIYGANYFDSILILKIIVLSVPFFSLVMFQRYFLQAIDMQKLAMIITGAALFLNISLNVLLIPIYQGVGAAISTVVAALLEFICFSYIISKKIEKPIDIERCVKILISGSIMGLFIVFFPWKSLFIIIPSSAFIYLSVLILSGSIRKEDFLFFKSLLKSDS
jgi:O-antigen/teichoic acid export membrane protein